MSQLRWCSAQKGRCRDNVFVDRVWKSIKYEEVYLHAYETVQDARMQIGRYLEFYNSIRPHSSLGAFTPDQVYFNRLPEFPQPKPRTRTSTYKSPKTVRTTTSVERNLCFDTDIKGSYSLSYGDQAPTAPSYDYATLFVSWATLVFLRFGILQASTGRFLHVL
jgi:putative transposase